MQTRPKAWWLTEAVHRFLRERGVDLSVRTMERAVVDIREARRAAALATVRVETAPGDQLQINFGQNESTSAANPSGCFSWWRC